MTPARLVHHELCFGCGRSNLFGLLMELEPVGEREVRGRGFVKQDHQGSSPGTAHEGIVAAALSEAMAFAVGSDYQLASLELELKAPVPVGTFIEVEARAGELPGGVLESSVAASVEGKPVAAARATYRRG